jgi:hypothetical protein
VSQPSPRVAPVSYGGDESFHGSTSCRARSALGPHGRAAAWSDWLRGLWRPWVPRHHLRQPVAQARRSLLLARCDR